MSAPMSADVHSNGEEKLSLAASQHPRDSHLNDMPTSTDVDCEGRADIPGRVGTDVGRCALGEGPAFN